jgi:lycopene beta-cyclase
VRADRFYAAALDRLEGRADVRLGERVLDVRDDPGGEGVVVTTSSGALPARRAYDARGWQDEAATWQRFLGLEVEVARPVFDPGVATLMDFRLGDPGEARFAYVLPFSPTRALVEDTSLGGPAVPAAARRAAIAAYLAEHWGAGDVEVVREERGAVPMSPAPPAPVSRLVPVGQRAGATRPSSGYTVVRAQAHAAAVARAAARGTPPPARAGRRRYAALDALFLRALTAQPEVFGTLFERLARGVSGPAFARFMNDAARPADLAAVVGALTCPAFLGALAPRGPHARPAGGSARPATA